MSSSCPSLFLTNARSILPKMDELRLSMSALHAEVAIVTESWLDIDISDALLFINNCEIFRYDRKQRKGGGVCIWANSRFLPRLVPFSSSTPSSIELSVVRLYCISFSILCCGIYIPPGLNKATHDTIVDHLTFEFDRLLTMYPDDKIVLAGDFNDFDTTFLSINFGLVNRVVNATRNNAVLDHIWIDESLCDCYPCAANIGPPLGSSDHNCVFLRSVSVSQFPESRRPTLVWDFRESNVSEFLLSLSSTNFDVIKQETSVNKMCSKFYDLLAQSLSVFPSEVVYLSSSDKPWMTPVLKLLIEKRWKAFRAKHWNVYKHYKAKVQTEIQKAKHFWCQRQSKTSRGLWNIVRTFRGSNLRDPWRRLLDENGGLRELLTSLTTEFCKNFNTDDVDLSPLSEQEWDFHVSAKMVYDQLSRLNCRKATGPDQIPPRLFKAGAQFLCFPLAEIFNFSIKTRTFPLCFKRAHVCPIPKCSTPNVSDFRPISLLSPLSKIFERIIFEHVKLDLFSCYGTHQHAYRPLGSTASALVELCEQVTVALDSKNTSHVNVFCLDLCKAFDKLHHHRLLNYLSTCGINHGFLKWLSSYLSSRTMCVKILNSFGPIVEIPSGVPQGSVLGPFLFAAYMGSVNFCEINVECIKYADDVTLIEPLSCNEVSSVTLDNCIRIFQREGLCVNRAKCKQLRVCFCRPLPCRKCNNDSGFVNVSTLKILGLSLTDRLGWDKHISSVLKIASQRLHIIRCMKFCVTIEELIQIYHAIITSVLVYASPAFGKLPSTLLGKMEKFQRRAHRLICGPACNCSRFPPLGRRLEDVAVDLLLRAEANSDHPLYKYVPGRLPMTNRFRNPVCNTNRRLNSFLPWAARLHNMTSKS